MTELIDFITQNGTEILAGIGSIVGGFAILARFTPNKMDDKVIQKVLDFINWMGQNAGKAKNKE